MHLYIIVPYVIFREAKMAKKCPTSLERGNALKFPSMEFSEVSQPIDRAATESKVGAAISCGHLFMSHWLGPHPLDQL